jgi:methenyltetrahydromethanopterin cyclohydrolase
MLNHSAFRLFQDSEDSVVQLRCQTSSVFGARFLDAGVNTPGSLQAGVVLARLCLGDQAEIQIIPADADRLATNNAIQVRTDLPVRACLGAQYAGWPIQTDDYFAMGSGPMRMARGRERVLEGLGLSETPKQVVGVLESDKFPTESAIELIAKQCGVAEPSVHLAIAPTTSIAGSLQVVARSVETAMHKLHELKFDVRTIVSGTGHAPLPPPAKPGDMIGGIGRTNDAVLYGATVTLWVDHDDDAIDAVADRIPSSGSNDHGQPFAKIFAKYDNDFYKVDPMLFSPAVVTIHNLRSGRSWTEGAIQTEILRQSFLT